MGDVRLKEELEGVAGDIYVLDASVVSPSHLAKISPTAIKKFLICVQVRRFKSGRGIKWYKTQIVVAGDIYDPGHFGGVSLPSQDISHVHQEYSS